MPTTRHSRSHSLRFAITVTSDSRYLVFQFLPHTVGVQDTIWRVLALCHERRNRAEYEGDLEIDDQLVVDLIEAAEQVRKCVEALETLVKRG